MSARPTAPPERSSSSSWPTPEAELDDRLDAIRERALAEGHAVTLRGRREWVEYRAVLVRQPGGEYHHVRHDIDDLIQVERRHIVVELDGTRVETITGTHWSTFAAFYGV